MTYSIDIEKEFVKIRIDGLLHLSFLQSAYRGFQSYQEGLHWYGIEIYLKDQVIQAEYDTKEKWLEIIKLIDSL